LYGWLKKYGEPNPRQADKADLSAENARLKADLKRMTEERDILKKAAKYFANDPG
jgi:transposase